MASLITRVRKIIGDNYADGNASQTFTDQDVQDALDRYRQDVQYITLREKPTITAGGGLVEYKDFYASYMEVPDAFQIYGIRSLTGLNIASSGFGTPGKFKGMGDWEDDVQLVDGAYNVLTPTVSDPLTGHWAFTTTQTLPVMLSGKTYDIYCAAAELLEDWAGQLNLVYNVSADGRTRNRSEMVTHLREQADRCWARKRPATTRMVRSDTNNQ